MDSLIFDKKKPDDVTPEEDHETSMQFKRIFGRSLLMFSLFLLYTIMVLFMKCKMRVKFDSLSKFVITSFIIGFLGKVKIYHSSIVCIAEGSGWLVVALSRREVFEMENLIAKSIQLVVDGVFYLILWYLTLKM